MGSMKAKVKSVCCRIHLQNSCSYRWAIIQKEQPWQKEESLKKDIVNIVNQKLNS